MGHAGRVGTVFIRPGAEAGGDVCVQGAGKGKVRVDCGAAADFGSWVVQVGVAAMRLTPNSQLGQAAGGEAPVFSPGGEGFTGLNHINA